MAKSRCPIWKELSKIDFNLYDSNTNKKGEISFDELSNLLLDKEGQRLPYKKIVVNGGHFIPNLKNQEKIGKNPLRTWELACQLVGKLRAMGFDAYTSLIINDLPFTPVERKKISTDLPKRYEKLMERYGLSYDHIIRIMNYSKIKDQVYTEKKLANRFFKEKRIEEWEDYEEEISNYCIQAIITYLLDILKQNTSVSIWIVPKCTHKNLINAIQIFHKKEKRLRNICYFITNNCYL
ncbi:hypothetical protein FJZ20_01720 [Candidatus Pacearchaeota archaeon]|nr:hypothetical protein [Candidatus Pacearchaeota archaeon]